MLAPLCCVSGRTSLCSGCGKRSAFSSLLEPRFVVADDTRERSLRDCWLAWARATVDFGGLSVLNFVVFFLRNCPKSPDSPKTKAVEAQETGQRGSICCTVPAISAHETLLSDFLDSF
jgi:hypothetical protein